MSVSTLNSIQNNVALYGLSTLLVLGNFGNLFTILILQRLAKRRINSCSLYLLSASISNWIVINTALVSNIIGVDHIDPQNTSNVICKLRWAGVHALLMLSRSFMVAACIDRWALCSINPSIKAFSRPHIAIRVILILLVVWSIIPIHLAIFFNNSTGRCIAMPESYAFFYAIYSLIVIGILPLVLMIVFSLLAWHNLQKIQSRVVPMGEISIQIHGRDRTLMKMLSGEVFIYCLTTVPYPIDLIYSVATNSISAYKSPTRLAMESLIGYIVSPLLNFMYCCVQFYVYAICSRKFRKEFINLFRRRTRETNNTALNVVTNQPNRKNSKSTDPLAKIRPMISKKPSLVQPLSRSNTMPTSSGLTMLNTRIQSTNDPSYQPLVTISDNENSDEEDFISPIQKLTKEELREELKIFKNSSQAALLANDDDDTGDIQFRIQQPIKRSICCYQYPFSLKDSSCTIS